MSNENSYPYRKALRETRQQGSALLVAVTLLLLAALMALLALNVGVFEQRSSGNDLRAKVVHQIAEGGIAQGFEFLYRANQSWIDDSSRWELCGASDLTFPCGAVPAAQRGSMYRLKAGAHTVAGLDADLTKYMLPIPNVLPASGAVDVAYGVAPVVCRLPLPLPPAGTIACATGMSNLSDRRVVTFVSVAQVRGGDSGRTTLTQTIARTSLLAQSGGLPAVVATGNVTPNGGGDIVAMPDAAGEGLDLAVWTRRNVDSTVGAFGTCGRAEWLSSCGISLSNKDWMSDGSVVNQCTCDKAKKAALPEGWEILDADANAEGINRDVKPEEFPCDLFEFAFNVKAWVDDTPKDNFCETRIPRSLVEVNGVQANLYPDEAYLYQYASKIIDGNVALQNDKQKSAPPLGPSSSGIIWCQSDCLQSKVVIGSVAKPVMVVVDGDTQFHATVYGLVFVRDPNGSMSASTGGSAQFKGNAQSAVFGSVLVQGQVPSGSGGGLIYGDPDILKALVNEPELARFDTLRGGWSDRYSY